MYNFLLLAGPILLMMIYFSLLNVADSYGGLGNLVSLMTSVLTFLYVVLTGRYVILTREMVYNMAKNQEEQSRPYIIPDIIFENGVCSLLLENIGKLPAREVSFKFTPELIIDNNCNLSTSIFDKPFSIFPPSKKIKIFMDVDFQMFSGKYPVEWDVDITYSFEGKNVTDSYHLDIRPYKNMTYHIRKDIHDLAKALNETNKHLGKLAKAVKSDGIYVKNRRDIEKERKEEEEWIRQRIQNKV